MADTAVEDAAQVGSGFMNLKIDGDALASDLAEAKDKPPVEPEKELKVAKTPAAPIRPISEKGRKNWEQLEKDRDDAKKETAATKKALEDAQKDWEAKLAEASKPKASPEIEAELKTAREKVAGYERDLRAFTVTRAAHEELTPKRQEAVNKITALLNKSGADQSVLDAAKHWDYDTLAAFGEDTSVPAGVRRDINRLLDQVRGIDDEITARTADPEQGYKSLQERQMADQRARLEANLHEQTGQADVVFKEALAHVPAIQENAELVEKLKGTLTGLAGGKGCEAFTPKRIMQDVAAKVILEVLASNQKAKIDTLEKEIKELKEAAGGRRSRVPGASPSANHRADDEDTEEAGSGIFTGGGIRVQLNGRG